MARVVTRYGMAETLGLEPIRRRRSLFGQGPRRTAHKQNLSVTDGALRSFLAEETALQFLRRPCVAIVQRAQPGSDTPRPRPLAQKSAAARREADARASEPCR